MDAPDKKPDLSEIFDLKRHKAVAGYVARFVELYEQRIEVNNDFTELTNEVREDDFSTIEVSAIKDIAKWKANDKVTGAAAKLAALRRVANALKLDLFAWADADRGDKAA
jgi:hypothetical protein